MLKLYHFPGSRSSRIIWLLEELGAPYEIIYTNILRRSGRGAPDPVNPHPDKRVPALLHNGALITESSAVTLYLTDLFPDKNLAPAIKDPARGEYLTWLAFYAGEIEPAFAAKEAGRTDNDPHAAKAWDRVLARVVNQLRAGKYLMGEQFSAVDVLVSANFRWWSELLPADSPEINEWLQRVDSRPAAIAALAKDAEPVAV